MYLFIFITKYETYTYVFIHKTSDLIVTHYPLLTKIKLIEMIANNQSEKTPVIRM